MPRLDNEAEFAERAMAGDRDAYQDLCLAYQSRLHGHVWRLMGNEDDTQEIVQQTFIKGFVAVTTGLRERPNMQAWFYRIATNLCLDILRRRQRMRFAPWQNQDHDHLLISGRLEQPEQRAVLSETQAQVRAVIVKMSQRHALALQLREYRGLSCAEIGREMGLTRSAVKSMLFRAREEFRRVYQQTYPKEYAERCQKAA